VLVPAGILIDGKYELRSAIGSGGMGVVYEAYHLSLERIVALKMLTAGTTADAEDRQRFEREALILSRLSHPNIVQFYAYGIWNNVPYIVIERVNGQSLQHLLTKNEPLNVPFALDVARQVCDGLQHVHANDVLHRDLKPTNILTVYSPDGGVSVKLIDFGLAKLIGWNNFQKLTQTGMALGSVMYASPEQCLGQSVGARSDIYSLGCVLYQMLTGYPPFTADNATAVMFQQLNESVGCTEHWSKVPEELQPLLSKCMAKEKDRRYSSADALREDLEKVISGQSAELEGIPVPAEATFRNPSNPFDTADAQERTVKRGRFAVGALASLTFFLLVSGIIFLATQNATQPTQQSSSSSREELYKLVHTRDATDEGKVKRVLSLLESYRGDRASSLDRTNLVLEAYILVISFYDQKKDFAVERRLCKQALEDCSRVGDSEAGDGYLQLLLVYHKACLQQNCHISLVPLLEDNLKRYLKATRVIRSQVFVELAADYLELERMEDARRIAGQLAVEETKQENNGRKQTMLRAYRQLIWRSYEKNDFASLRKYGKRAVEECRGVGADGGDAFLEIVHRYHVGCVAEHCQLALIPLVEESLGRYPAGNVQARFALSVSLAADYLDQERFAAAREVAKRVPNLEIDGELKNRYKQALSQAYRELIWYYYGKKDFAKLRQYCRKAIEDCRGIDAQLCDAYLDAVRLYHEGCVPVHSELSLIPLLQETLERYPHANGRIPRELYEKLGEDYLKLERFDDALQAAKQAQVLAVDDAQKNPGKWIELRACELAIKHYSAKKDYGSMRRYCKLALDECRSINPCLWVVHQYHLASLQMKCQLELLPLLEETVKRYPKEDPTVICGLYLYMAEDYLELGQLAAARQAANKALSIAVVDAHKECAKRMLEKCDSNQRKTSIRKY